MFKALDDMIADAKEEGREEGRDRLLRELIRKKLDRYDSIESIAQMLEVDVETVEKIAKKS